MHRSELTIDLGALRRNVRVLRRTLGAAQLWAVVKANGYGHGAVDVARTALDEGAAVLGVATATTTIPIRS
jgi:alanine racemase